MSRFLSPAKQRLAPYVPGEQPQGQTFIKLNTNESPYPPSPQVIRALEGGAAASLNLYSDPQARALRETLAQYHGLTPEQVAVTNGSDEGLAFAFMAFCDGDTGACFADLTYGFYRVYAQLFSLDTLVLPLNADYRIDPAAYYNCGRTVFLANPNAPTGIALGLDAVEAIVANNPSNVVLVDEAYVDFGGQSAVALIPRYENLLVVQTYSKSRSMAGARLGVCLGQEALIADIERIRNSFHPYNVNRLTQLAGREALLDDSYFCHCRDKIVSTREDTKRRLEALSLRVLDSKANFLFAACPGIAGKTYYEALRAHGILVRYFDGPRTQDFVRISIGTPEDMDALLAATKQILEEYL